MPGSTQVNDTLSRIQKLAGPEERCRTLLHTIISQARNAQKAGPTQFGEFIEMTTKAIDSYAAAVAGGSQQMAGATGGHKQG